MTSKFEAVVFDMDGVLIDAREWHYEALNAALEPFNFQISRDLHLRELNGLPTRTKLEYLSSNFGFPRKLHPLISALKQDRTKRIANLKCFPNQNHLIMFRKLKEKNLLIGLATNSIRETTIQMLKLANIIEYFDYIGTNEDVALPKPSPEIYLSVSEKFQLSPNRILVVEDSEFGVQAALSAGCRVIQVQNTIDVHWNLIEKHLS